MNYYIIHFYWWGFKSRLVWGKGRMCNKDLNISLYNLYLGPLSIAIGRDFGA